MVAEMNDIFKAAVETRLLHSCEALLAVLHSKHGVGLQPSEISRMTGLSLASIGYAKKELLGAGFIEQRHTYRDQRGTKIYLTEKGRDESERLWSVIKRLSAVADQYHGREP